MSDFLRKLEAIAWRLRHVTQEEVDAALRKERAAWLRSSTSITHSDCVSFNWTATWPNA